jgi:HD-GYP domain-containing protein (c-di-GMP phosphodiesterase class II)
MTRYVEQHSWGDKSLNQHISAIHQEMHDSIPMIDRISFAIYDRPSGLLKTYADSTPKGELLTHYECPLDQLPSLRECAELGTTRQINNISTGLQSDSGHSLWLNKQGFASSVASPTYTDKQFIGFVFLNSYTRDAFAPEVLTQLQPYLDSIRQAAVHEYDIVHTILDAVEHSLQRAPKLHCQIKDHQQRMFYFTQIIARGVSERYQLNCEDIDNITQFSRFHDIGKLSLPPRLLLKQQALAAMERVQITDHIARGVEIIDKIISTSGKSTHSCLTTLKQIISHHQEMLDGSGYPHGLSGEQIPIASRIITVANIFDALTSHRPYKQARSVPFALLELEKMVHQHKIDSQCVNALRENQECLKKIIQSYPETDPKDYYQ